MHRSVTTSSLLMLWLNLTSLIQAWTLRIVLPHVPYFNLYNPSTLPCSTHATLYKMAMSLSADITRRNTLEFSNLDEGSYLLTITTREWTFSPLRVDVNTSSINAEGKSEARVDFWQTFWGNEWGNKGEYRGGGAVDLSKQSNQDDGEDSVVTVEAKPTGKKEYYTERAGFSPLQFLRSPMILMAVFSLALIVGLPYLMDNMDEDTRAEFEEMQKQGITGRGGASNPADSIQNFDLAGWMAGKTTGSNTAESEPESRRRK